MRAVRDETRRPTDIANTLAEHHSGPASRLRISARNLAETHLSFAGIGPALVKGLSAVEWGASTIGRRAEAEFAGLAAGSAELHRPGQDTAGALVMNDVEVCWTPRWRRMDSNHWSRSQDTPVSFAKNDDAPKVQPEAVAAGVLRGRPRPHGALRLYGTRLKADGLLAIRT